MRSPEEPDLRLRRRSHRAVRRSVRFGLPIVIRPQLAGERGRAARPELRCALHREGDHHSDLRHLRRKKSRRRRLPLPGSRYGGIGHGGEQSVVSAHRQDLLAGFLAGGDTIVPGLSFGHDRQCLGVHRVEIGSLAGEVVDQHLV